MGNFEEASLKYKAGERSEEITKEILERLLKCVETNTLPESEGGFFYGHQFQDEAAEESKEEDIKFCKEALQAIKDGNQVIYSCWY